MATVDWGGLNLGIELNISFVREKMVPLEVEYGVLVVPKYSSGVVDVLKSHKRLRK